MPRVIVLFNLRQGVSPAEYEAWVRDTELATVNALPSVAAYSVHRATGLLGGGPSPYAYVEVLDITGLDSLSADVSAPPMPEIAAAFRAFADDPVFIVTEALD